MPLSQVSRERARRTLPQAPKVSEPTLSRILDKLEEYGFVVSERRGQEKVVRLHF